LGGRHLHATVMARRASDLRRLLRGCFVADQATGHDGLRRQKGDGEKGNETGQSAHHTILRKNGL